MPAHEKLATATLSDDERRSLATLAPEHLPPFALAVASARAVCGIADVVVDRASVPRSVDLCAAILASHDATATVARAAAATLDAPTSMELEALRWCCAIASSCRPCRCARACSLSTTTAWPCGSSVTSTTHRAA